MACSCAGKVSTVDDPSKKQHEHIPGPNVLEIDIVMSSLLFMLITYYSVVTDTNEHD